jgi:hypothetical protein
VSNRRIIPCSRLVRCCVRLNPSSLSAPIEWVVSGKELPGRNTALRSGRGRTEHGNWVELNAVDPRPTSGRAGVQSGGQCRCPVAVGQKVPRQTSPFSRTFAWLGGLVPDDIRRDTRAPNATHTTVRPPKALRLFSDISAVRSRRIQDDDVSNTSKHRPHPQSRTWTRPRLQADSFPSFPFAGPISCRCHSASRRSYLSRPPSASTSPKNMTSTRTCSVMTSMSSTPFAAMP